MTKIERWKPEKVEIYWLVDSTQENFVDWYFWKDDDIDERNFANRNCFRTEAEAQSAAKKVKALLLSIQDNGGNLPDNGGNLPDNGNNLATNLQDKQLPKLTAEVFDRPDCPEWAKWAAVDAAGLAYWYQYPPIADERVGAWTHLKNKRQLIDQYFNRSDWQNSLIERPAKLPEWCKVGEYAAHKVGTQWFYFKIQSIYNEKLYDENGRSLNISNATQARLRPYNAEEMKALVGEKVTNKEGNIYLCTAFIKETYTCNAAVDIDSWVTAGGLLEYGYVIAGKPAGVLEHLEDGEWVQ